MRRRGVCTFQLTLVCVFDKTITRNQLEFFERIAIQWFRPQFNFPFYQKLFGHKGAMNTNVDLVCGNKLNRINLGDFYD